MKRYGMAVFVFLGIVLVAAGCNKKSTDQASLASAPAGFDSMTTEELAQLPQAAATTPSQQAAVEVLPVETSPVTQSVPPQAASAAETAAPVSKQASQDNPERNKNIQTALKNAGLYNGNIDGKLGPASHRAIETFQKNNGLKVDGKVGPKTWTALEPYLNQPAASSTTSSTT